MELFESKVDPKDLENILNAIESLKELDTDSLIDSLNIIKLKMHEISPFSSEPVDCVLWVKNSDVYANDYNPNSVAPPEMQLLEHSIDADGYTQPIVTMEDEEENFEVVDGFHRNRVGTECPQITKRVHGYLPIVKINTERSDKTDRMASTVRHNRARGKHKVESMSEMVIYLKRRNWSDKKIAKELGMEADEVLRLAQVTGLAEAFQDKAFSQEWEAAELE